VKASVLASDHRTVHGQPDVPHPGPALAAAQATRLRLWSSGTR